ncbi:hypothetical protein [Antarcticimicrobium sediminis]|uniref:Uncharacterized protein n=1 Tax=Antarcticimicrobium sediminis TaxID=2546227 RepID=A0A4R5EQL6_9RHOB|nr:hypothetical protein [Antarcticimicrobium sediminis]TDE37089.1 hypothetical protein E1B25_13415 [Antarcticimicrobium sediminis]
MAAPGPGHKRILVGAGSFADARAALAILDLLSGVGITDIGGLFLEDREVMEAATPRTSALVSPRGAIGTAPSRQVLRLMWRSDARAFRDRLIQLAARRALRWSFERAPGEPVAGLCNVAHSWDWLLIGHLPSGAHAGRVVGVFHGAAAGGDGVGELTEGLARSLGTGAELIADTLPEADILARLERVHAAAVVIDAGAGPFRTAAQIRALLAAARCPILVLGAAGIPSLVEYSTQIPQPPPGQAG